MNVKETLSAIRKLRGMTAICKEGEFRVVVLSVWCEGSNALERLEMQEALAYYTTDANDALATAKLMSIKAVKAIDAQREISSI